MGKGEGLEREKTIYEIGNVLFPVIFVKQVDRNQVVELSRAEGNGGVYLCSWW